MVKTNEDGKQLDSGFAEISAKGMVWNTDLVLASSRHCLENIRLVTGIKSNVQ